MPLSRSQSLLIAIIAAFTISFALPSTSLASGLAMAQFEVSSYLVRIWLAMVFGTGVVIGVMLALDSFAPEGRMEPVVTPDKKVQLIKRQQLSYRKISGGLLCVAICSVLFVTSVFILPDKRTGHSGLNKIITHFKKADSNSTPTLPESVNSVPVKH